MRKLKTAGQIAKLAGISGSTVRRLADKGEIRFKRDQGNNYRMFDPKDAIEDLEKLGFVFS